MSKLAKTKSSPSKSAKRRRDLRRNLPKPTFEVKALLMSREFFNVAIVMVGMLIVVGFLIIESREQVKVRDGQIMSQTRLKRINYSTKDEEATERKRESARLAAPRIYTIDELYLSTLEEAFRGLPRAVADKQSLEEVSPDLIERFMLDESGLRELRLAIDADGQTTSSWNTYVSNLMAQMRSNPLFASDEFQVFLTTAAAIESPEGGLDTLPYDRAIELKPEAGHEAPRDLRDLVHEAGFTQRVQPLVLGRIMYKVQPVAIFDAERTEQNRTRVAAMVADVLIDHKKGEVIFHRGDVLSPRQYDMLQTESEKYTQNAEPWMIWQPRLGLLGLVSLVLTFIAVFVYLFYPRITRNFLRTLALGLLMSSMLLVSVLLTIQAPKVILGAALAPTLFLAIVTLLAYDKRLAVIISGLQASLVVMALDLSVGWFLLLLIGCCTAIVNLGEVRHRNSLIRAATVTAIVVAFGAITLGLLELPGSAEDIYQQVGLNAIWGITASYGIGFMVLGLLPIIENLFDITTGMTLAELRDPRQPLLRQLQQKAPGTYNHSLQVANIAEAAADAIGADSLLIYVGALYHDIGKMSKPEYFIENQTGGMNKHEKLSPAMSLLVIIGHVKDGIELAREYGLPRSMQHFIEAHHGTTLVEFFYHAAKTQAEEGTRKDTVDEIEFRYPGPKPQTKEAAIMMLSDCVESATRAMGEPNPSRIESLVRELSHKRLADGQFDQCDLTFRELTKVEDAIISRVSAIHHGRISYPSGKAGKSDEDTPSSGDTGQPVRSVSA
ncbi:MAG: HDIG domain-containing protein [Planctomycetota bacterium]|nr:HDIG domain-containing protein [Planctomycetota bacterium]